MDRDRSTSDYEIEKDVPIPEVTGKGKSKYPFHSMEVGDSIFSESRSIRQAAYAHARRNNKKFIVRYVEGGYRVWRTE